jgi:predicted PurR-regulated permease PerM
MSDTIKLPFYARLALVLLSLCLILLIVYLGQNIFIPILLSVLFAILLRPVVVFLNKKLRMPHVVAVALAVTFSLLVLIGIVMFVSWQIGDIANDWDNIKRNFSIHLSHIQAWVKDTFNISYKEQNKYIQQARQDSLNGKALVQTTLLSFTDVLFNLILIPFYTFLILLYRNLFISFLSKLFSAANQEKLEQVLMQVKMAVQSFLVGLMIEMLIVTGLTSIGFMLVGIEYAILLGVITGILNLIPYIGIIVAAALSIFATLTSSTDISVITGVISVNIIVQIIDNNILVPMIVSSKVKINAFVSIIAIVIGGAVAGISGMFLAIPIVAILKVVFDNIESLEPVGFVMGDDMPKSFEWNNIRLPLLDAGNSSDIGLFRKKMIVHTTHEPTEETQEKEIK